MQDYRNMTDYFSFITDEVRHIETKQNAIKTPTRYDSDNIGVADISRYFDISTHLLSCSLNPGHGFPSDVLYNSSYM